MSYNYGAQTYPNNMRNACDMWDKIPLTGVRG
jgi:hypothetical protein